MQYYHSRHCTVSPGFPHCNCGTKEMVDEFERLHAIIGSIKRLIDDAETIIIESNGRPYTPKMVHTSDLEAILEGRMYYP